MNKPGKGNSAQTPQEIAVSTHAKPPVILGYATAAPNALPREPKALQKWPLTVAIYCSAIPIAFMTIGALAWLSLRDNAVASITGFAMLLGVLLMPFSAGFLCKYYLSSLKLPASPAVRRRQKRLFRWAALLLFVTLPMIVVYASVASELNDVYLVTVRNASRFPINQMTLTVKDRDVTIPDLSPGATTSFRCHFGACWSVGYDLKLNGKPLRGESECLNADAAGNACDPIVVVGDGGVTVQAASWGTDREHF
ncbi:MAG TPA: hypothetical protein VFE47_26960 [Tepidisphaeraceae bacterium]|jgi:hypothetical protein|nr:hypothetical protein [Tepidisphaeraceae bacterium]